MNNPHGAEFAIEAEEYTPSLMKIVTLNVSKPA